MDRNNNPSHNSSTWGAEIERKYGNLSTGLTGIKVKLETIEKDVKEREEEAEDNRAAIAAIKTSLDRIEKIVRPWDETHIMFKRMGAIFAWLAGVVTVIYTVLTFYFRGKQ